MNDPHQKKILVVAESIDVEDSSGTKGRVALIQNLHKLGYDLKVFHYTRKNIKLSGISCVAIKERKWNHLFLLSRLERQLRYKLNLDLHKPLENFFGFSFTLFNDRNSIVNALKKNTGFEPDLVLTLSKGGSFRPHHALLKIPKWHDRWMAYIHDPYPMHSYPRPYDWVEPGHQKKRKFFLKVAEKARYAAFPSKLLAEWMESYFPKFKGKQVVIPHQIDEDQEMDKALPEFFKKNSFTIVHAGTLLSARNPLTFLKAFRRFLEATPEAQGRSQLFFLGPPSKYSAAFKKLNQELPEFYSSATSLPFATVWAVQKAASVNLILEAKGPISPFLPGKFAHCVEADKSILLLGPYYSECRRLLGQDYQFWSEIDEVEKIATLISSLYEKWLKGPEALRLGRPDLKEYLSKNYLKSTIENLVKNT